MGRGRDWRPGLTETAELGERCGGLLGLPKREERTSARTPTPSGVSGPHCCRPQARQLHTGAATSQDGWAAPEAQLSSRLPYANRHISLFLKPFLSPVALSAREHSPQGARWPGPPRGAPSLPMRFPHEPPTLDRSCPRHPTAHAGHGSPPR